MAISANASKTGSEYFGFPPHHRFGAGVGTRGAALDEVAGHREGPAGQADERHARGGQRVDHEANGLHDVGDVLRCVQRAQALQIGGTGEGTRHHRPATGLDVHAEADGGHRHHDVGEQDGGIDAVAAHRLQGQLGGELRAMESGEDASGPARSAIFGQRTARLAHEPHRYPIDGEAPAGSQEGRIRERHGSTLPVLSARPEAWLRGI